MVAWQHAPFERHVRVVGPQHSDQRAESAALPPHELEVVKGVHHDSVTIWTVHHDHGEELQHLGGDADVLGVQAEGEGGHEGGIVDHGLDTELVVHGGLHALQELCLDDQVVLLLPGEHGKLRQPLHEHAHASQFVELLEPGRGGRTEPQFQCLGELVKLVLAASHAHALKHLVDGVAGGVLVVAWACAQAALSQG